MSFVCQVRTSNDHERTIKSQHITEILRQNWLCGEFSKIRNTNRGLNVTFLNYIFLSCNFNFKEDLLLTNNLFVDYFNNFLLNPILGEKLKFNFVSGDLEIIEEGGDENDPKEEETAADELKLDTDATGETQKSNDQKIKVLKRSEKSLDDTDTGPTSTAQVVKKKLETQLKSIFKQSNSITSTPSNHNFKSLTSVNNVDHRTDDETKSEKSQDVRRKELLNQINQHSFKDIDLIRIESRIEPSDLKDLKAAQEAKIPKVQTVYNVNVLKKPYSMKWLRNRRLTLFLQSELYSEFKLAMILSQFGLFNNDLGSD